MSKLRDSTFFCARSMPRDTIGLSMTLALLEAELLHHRPDPVAGEDAHQIVVEAEVELDVAPGSP